MRAIGRARASATRASSCSLRCTRQNPPQSSNGSESSSAVSRSDNDELCLLWRGSGLSDINDVTFSVGLMKSHGVLTPYVMSSTKTRTQTIKATHTTGESGVSRLVSVLLSSASLSLSLLLSLTKHTCRLTPLCSLGVETQRVKTMRDEILIFS